MAEIDYELYMDTAVLAGKIMLESNAETYRVEDTVTRILQITKLEMIDALALTTGLVATLDSPHMHAITVVKRISNRTVNLNKITRVNDVSRKLTEGAITVEQAYDALQNIDEIQYNELQRMLAVIGFIQAIVLMFQGGKNEFFAILPISISVAIMTHFGRRWRVKAFILDMVASFVIALMASVISRIMPIPVQEDILIISAIMPLVPGTALTNGVRDMFRGDYMSGGAKILEAFMIAIFIAIGIGTGLILGGQINL